MSEEQFDKAIKLYQMEQYSEAREAFLELLKVYPQRSEIWLNLGNAEFKLNALPNAEQSWQRCLEMNPMETNAYLNLGNLYYKQERPRRAINYWKQFLTLKQNQASVWLNLGLAYEKQGNLDDAFNCFKEYIHQDPTSAAAIKLKQRMKASQTAYLKNVNVAEQALSQGKLKLAREAFQQSFLSHPGTPKHYKAYAALLFKLNQLNDALEYYLKSYHGDREDTGVLINLGVIYEKQKDYVNAVWAYHLAIELQSPDRDKVQPRLERLVSEHGDGFAKTLAKAEEHLGNRRYSEAEFVLKRLQELYGYAPDIQAHVEKALEHLEQQTNPRLRATEVYFREGEKAREEGKYDQALSFYNKYLNVYPDGPHADLVRENKDVVEGQIGHVIATMLNMDKPLSELFGDSEDELSPEEQLEQAIDETQGAEQPEPDESSSDEGPLELL